MDRHGFVSVKCKKATTAVPLENHFQTLNHCAVIFSSQVFFFFFLVLQYLSRSSFLCMKKLCVSKHPLGTYFKSFELTALQCFFFMIIQSFIWFWIRGKKTPALTPCASFKGFIQNQNLMFKRHSNVYLHVSSLFIWISWWTAYCEIFHLWEQTIDILQELIFHPN